MSDSYASRYRNINFRKYPYKYKIGRGEQGVLIAEPYKSEILPHWKFATEADAKQSSKKIYNLFLEYKAQNDFVGMDMARKYLQMGFTRARRYANHASGTKYDKNQDIKEQAADWNTSEKAKAAGVFKKVYDQVRIDKEYIRMSTEHKDHSA